MTVYSGCRVLCPLWVCSDAVSCSMLSLLNARAVTVSYSHWIVLVTNDHDSTHS